MAIDSFLASNPLGLVQPHEPPQITMETEAYYLANCWRLWPADGP